MFLAGRIESFNSINSLKNILSSEGSCLISDKNLVLTADQWQTLNHETRKLEPRKIDTENTDTLLSFKLSTIKLSKNNDIKNKVIYDVASSVQIRHFMKALTGINHAVVCQCECHFCEEGDFISNQSSENMPKTYKYVMNLFLDGSYTGGEHVVHGPGKKEHIYSPKSGEILISSCEFSHEVKPVISGKRNLVLAFIEAW